MTKFSDLIRTRFPGYRLPGDEDIRYDLIRYHRHTEEVTFEMENEYVMEFCTENGVALEAINGVGHVYRYGAAMPTNGQ